MSSASRINKPESGQRRLNDRRRQPIAHLVHLRRDGGTEIIITAAAIDSPCLTHERFQKSLIVNLAHF
jgi:hypothetical protein